MFVGHAALALAARPLLPRRSLGTLFAAVFWLDLLWPLFLLLGWERVEIRPGATAATPLDFVHYPWTHSLLAAAFWAVLFAFVVVRRRGSGRELGLLSGLVMSHWVLDVVSHRPDLPLFPGGGPLWGLGLWHSIPATFAVEGALFAAGIAIYLRATRAVDRAGTLALASLLVLISAIWIAGPFGPPPPSAQAIAVVGLVSWLLPPWAGWADRHRKLDAA